jgi:hypothetical protein
VCVRVEDAGDAHPPPRDLIDHAAVAVEPHAEPAELRIDREAEEAELAQPIDRPRASRSGVAGMIASSV